MKPVKVTKREIVGYIEHLAGGRDRAQEIVDAMINQVKYCLSCGYVIELRGFGTLKAVLKKGMKNRRNPKTGETIEAAKPDRLGVKFKASSMLLKEINNE